MKNILNAIKSHFTSCHCYCYINLPCVRGWRHTIGFLLGKIWWKAEIGLNFMRIPFWQWHKIKSITSHSCITQYYLNGQKIPEEIKLEPLTEEEIHSYLDGMIEPKVIDELVKQSKEYYNK